MTVRRLDPDTGDIVTSGEQFLTGRAEVAQTIKTRLGLFFGEYFRDVTDGTPWFEEILGKGSTLTRRDATLRRRIAQTDRVVQLVRLDTNYDIDSRGYDVTGEVLTDFGVLDIQQSGTV